MKKFNLSFIAIAFISILYSNVSAQCFIKGDKIIDTGIKISIYNIKAEDDDNNNDEEDKAASYTIPVGFEYAVSDKIGVGLELGFCNYFTEEDSITRSIAKANSFDFLLQGNYHWVRKGKIDLYSGLGLGFSAFEYESKDSQNSRYKATGGYLRLGLINSRFYITNGVALGIKFGIPFMNFDSGRIKDNLGTDAEYPLTFTGWDLGAGISVKF